jgi:PPOX class probable F420-dependent enzyme
VTALVDSDLELLRGKNFAHFATIRRDGSPQVTVTWVDVAGGDILVNSAIGRAKERNLRRDPRASVTVHEEGNAYRWLRIEGAVVEFVTGEGADRHIDALNRKYRGRPWEFVPGQERVIFRIRPGRILRRDE